MIDRPPPDAPPKPIRLSEKNTTAASKPSGNLAGGCPEVYVNDFGEIQIADIVSATDELRSISNDRAAIMVAVGIVDVYLEAALKNLMRDDVKLLNRYFNDGGALGSVRAKLDLAYLLKLIDEKLYDNATVIITIRNKLAHKIHIVDFNHLEISKLVIKLQNPYPSHGAVISPAFSEMPTNKDRIIYVWNVCCRDILLSTGANEYLSRFYSRDELQSRFDEHLSAQAISGAGSDQ